MAKWDLSKLPEGRKPLDDAWFKERADMQDRIKELEAKLEECLECNEQFSSAAKILKARIEKLTGGKDD